MAIGHCRVTTITRAKGHTAAAALAYRFGVALRCPRTGERPDFSARTRRGEIAGTGIEAARPTPIAESAQTFAGAIEAAERRRDSRLARDCQVALPHELDEPARLELARTFAAAVAERYGTVCAWAVHKPHEGDARNHHVHVLMATRALDKSGQLAGKLRRLDHPWTSGDEVAGIRNLWADLADQALKRAGLDARVHVGRRLDAVPTPSVSPAVAGQERRRRRRRIQTNTSVDGIALTDAQARQLTDGDPIRYMLAVAADDEARADIERAQGATSARLTEPGFATDVARAAGHRASEARREGTTGRRAGTAPRYERRARSRLERGRERARDQAPERRRRPRRREEPIATAPAALEATPAPIAEPERPPRRRRRRARPPQALAAAPEARETTTTPIPEPERPPRRRRRRVRPALTLPAPRPAPIDQPIAPQSPTLAAVEARLDQLSDARDRVATLDELEALSEAIDPPEEWTDPSYGDIGMEGFLGGQDLRDVRQELLDEIEQRLARHELDPEDRHWAVEEIGHLRDVLAAGRAAVKADPDRERLKRELAESYVALGDAVIRHATGADARPPEDQVDGQAWRYWADRDTRRAAIHYLQRQDGPVHEAAAMVAGERGVSVRDDPVRWIRVWRRAALMRKPTILERLLDVVWPWALAARREWGGAAWQRGGWER